MTAPAITGPRVARTVWAELDEEARRHWLAGLRPPEPTVEAGDILAAIRQGGDEALREAAHRFDGAAPDGLWATEGEFRAAESEVTPELGAALRASMAAVRLFHADQRAALRPRRVVQTMPGVTAWRRWVPLGRVGGYIPGGRAALASSVIMLGVPARLAGVEDLILATPAGHDGRVAPSILMAARLVGVDRVLKVGGAQAIAALAYGTESVPRVDRIVGAGGPWVTAAKRAVAGEVSIDLPAGPSECVVLAGSGADPTLVALDLLAQAEHGPDSLAILVTDDERVADAVLAALPGAAAGLATGEAAIDTFAQLGRVVLVPALEEAVPLIDSIAPEHVSLQCTGARELAERLRFVGAVFIGPWTAIAGGDYAIGTNHVLPAGGAARAWSGVGVETFGRWMEIAEASSEGIRRMGPTVAALAGAEGLPLHAASVTARASLADREAASTSAAERTDRHADPMSLLRRPDPITPYPAEPSDDALADAAGVAVEDVIRADLNTLGGGALPGAAGALAAYRADRAVEYSDLSYARLRAALGKVIGVDPGRIIPGAGADELIRLVTTMAVGAGDAVVIPTPTFPMFAAEASLAGARRVDIPRGDLAVRQSVEEIRSVAERESARLVWLCTPNNPTGDEYTLDEIRELATDLSAIVVVDEVYLEFAGATAGVATETLSGVQLQTELPNLLILRSMAKAYGLAGARVGYLIVPEGLAERFDGARLPLSVAGPSEAMALGALADQEGARRRLTEIVAQRERLVDLLDRRGCRTLPSVTNFVTFRPADAAALAEGLLARGIAIRVYPPGLLDGWLRMTARDEPGTQRILDALDEILQVSAS